MTGEPSDADLVRDVLQGRVDRFEILIRRYQRLVATAALRMGVPRHEVDDVTNEVFYKVYRNLGRYRPELALSTWLYRITVNAAVDRKRGRRRESLHDEIPAGLADARPGADALASAGERAALLQEALRRVPERYRGPLVLAHIEGLSIDEVGRVLQLPEGTVKSRLFRARAILKQIIESEFPALAPNPREAES